MAFLGSSGANPQSQTARISAKDPLDSESRSERHPRSQALTADPASGETPKHPSAPSFSTEPPTPECTSQRQQPSGDLQTATAGNAPMSPLALESPSNGRSTTNSPSRDYQPAGNPERNPPVAEDPSRILVAEVNSMGVPTHNPRPGRRLKTPLVAVTRLSKLGSVAGGTEHIIKDSTKEISDSNEGGEKSRNEDIMDGRYECLICEKYVKPVSFTWHCQICSRVLHLSCAAMEDWRCPTCHKDPLQNISDRSSEDKSRHPNSKRAFEEMEESITRDDDTDSETIFADNDRFRSIRRRS